MILLLFTILIFGSLCTVSFLITYWIFTTIKQAAGGEEPSINGIIMMQFTQLVQNFITAVGDMVSIVSGKFFGFISNIQYNLRTYLQIFVLVLLILSYTQEKEVFLQSVDQFWRCGLQPFFNSIIFTILQVGRLLYGGLVPIYNFDTLVVKQLIVGTRMSMFLCAGKSLFESLIIVLNIVISLFQSVTSWTGVGLTLSMENNAIFNELNIVRLVLNVQKLILKQQEVSGCICSGLFDVFEYIFIAFRQDELAFMINHLVNIPVSLFQALFQVIPPWTKIPLGTKLINHVNGFIYFLSSYADQVAQRWLIHTISLFDDNFNLEGVPREFGFTILGRLAMSGVHVAWTLYRGIVSMAIPIAADVVADAIGTDVEMQSPGAEMTKGDYMKRVFSMDQAMEQLNLALVSATNLGAWLATVVYEVSRSIGRAIDTGEPLSMILPEHKKIVCSDDNDVFFDNIACGIREFISMQWDLNFIAYSLLMELLFKSIINVEENALKTIQRYDGISFPRGISLTCEYRDSINYDLTAGECRCNMDLGYYKDITPEPGYPFGRPNYDKYCGQPNLQVDYFDKQIRMANYITSGLYETIKDIAKAWTFFILESQRTALKAALNLDNIIKGEYFDRKVNCGYGLSSTQLRKWWIDLDESPDFEGKAQNQRDVFRDGYCGSHLCSNLCQEADKLPYVHPVTQQWECEPIDVALSHLMCLTTQNPSGKYRTEFDRNGGVNRVQVNIPRCTTVNSAGCECNPLLANYCLGHQTFEDGVWVADDDGITTEADCVDEYSGGDWAVSFCTMSIKHPFYGPNPITQTVRDLSSDAKCKEEMDMREGQTYQFTPGQCSIEEDSGQRRNGELINATTKELCFKKTKPGVWHGPIDNMNQCACIRNFPDTFISYVNEPFRNRGLDKYRSPDVSVHWCNTFWAEWILYSVEQYSDVLEKAAGIFHPAYDSDADEGNKFCDSAAFNVFDTKVLRFPRYEFERDEDMYQRLKLTYTEKSCSLHGTTDFICSTSLSIRNALKLVIGEIRMIVMSLNKLIDGDFSKIHLAISERVCDAARTLAALSSILPSLISDAESGTAIQIAFSKAIYSVVHIITSALDILSVILTFLDDLIGNRLVWTSGSEFPIFTLAFTILNIFIDWIRMMLQGFGALLNEVHSGAGQGLFTVDRIIEILQVHLLNEAVIEIFGMVVKLLFEIFEFLTSGNIAGGFAAFFVDFFTIVAKTVILVVKQVGKVMSAILDMMGPAGAFIKRFAGTICGWIQEITCWFSSDMCELGCPGGLRRRHLFSAGTEDSKFQDIVWHLSHTIPWNGTSNCDMFVHAYKEYKWDDLRPIEHIELVNCIEMRMMMMKMNEHFNVSLPEDLIYNWQRKWELGYKFTSAGVIYLEHKLGSITTKQMLHKLKNKEIDFNQFLPLFSNMFKNVQNFFTLHNFNQGIEYVFRQYNPDIEKGDSAMSSVYRLYSIGGKAFNKVHAHVREQNLRKQFTLMYATIKTKMPRSLNMSTIAIPKHLSHGWHTYRNLAQAPKTSSKVYAKHLILKAAGVVTDITPCALRNDSYVCLNCVVLDNFLNAVIKDGFQMSFYYDYIYSQRTIPSFMLFWSNKTQSAWREDAKKKMGKAFGKTAGEVADATNTGYNFRNPEYNKYETYDSFLELNPEEGMDIEDASYNPNTDTAVKLQRARLKSYSEELNQTISFAQRNKRDWEWFLFEQGWNPFKEHAEVMKRPSFGSLLINFFTAGYYEYVPFFSRSLRYYLWQPLQDCPPEKMYCTHNTFEERQELIPQAFGYFATTVLIFFAAEQMGGIPIFMTITPYIVFIFAFIYMFVVYRYTYSCIPSLPNCLLEDIYVFFHDNLYPKCFCFYLPGLAMNCEPDTCMLCARITEFSECKKEVALINTMGILWTPVFWFRVYFPDVLLYLYKTAPFSWGYRNFDSLINVTQGIIEKTEPTQIELDCLNISYMDIILGGVGLWLVCQGLGLVAPLIVRATQHAITFLITYTTMIYSMIVSLELQTVMVKESDE